MSSSPSQAGNNLYWQSKPDHLFSYQKISERNKGGSKMTHNSDWFIPKTVSKQANMMGSNYLSQGGKACRETVKPVTNTKILKQINSKKWRSQHERKIKSGS